MKGVLLTFSLLTFFFSCPRASSSGLEGSPLASSQDSDDAYKEELLKKVTDLSEGVAEGACIDIANYPLKGVAFNTSTLVMLKTRIDLIAQVMQDSSLEFRRNRLDKISLIQPILELSPKLSAISFFYSNGTRVCEERLGAYDPPPGRKCLGNLCWESLQDQPWHSPKLDAGLFQEANDDDGSFEGGWTFPYFKCCHGRWMASYVRRVTPKRSSSGYLVADVDISEMGMNQCSHYINSSSDFEENDFTTYFRGTHKCPESSSCVSKQGFGWKAGGYECICNPGFYSKSNDTFQGSLVEVAWKTRKSLGSASAYEYLYKCYPCPDGCDPNNCSEKPCIAEYSWPFRITLLTFTCACILLTLTMMALVYKMRSLKVFKMASPTFLQICLLGCIIMYLEMAAIFPVLDVYFCVFTKWTRHMGFCITFSSLLMKTWRVSLTYRVKSAHKIKLTDKQLLQWMTPIVLIMGIYLGSWTISDPPKGKTAYDHDGLKFVICDYNYWDHAVAFGEMIFLLWGVKVCYGVRKAESYFDEAKCISFAVYNITFVNVIMASIHLYLFTEAGPDLKYFFGFLRTQISTSTTIALVFGPKFYRVFKGTGDELDSKYRSSGTGASFSINGLGGSGDQPHDVHEENEELKEEIQKLAAQIEFMKIVHMETNNRHLKPRSGGYFCEKNAVTTNLSQSGQSPSITKNSLSKADQQRSSGSEIATERV